MAKPVVCPFPREQVWLDPMRIGTLYAELGSRGLPAMLDRALHELFTVHCDLEDCQARSDRTGFVQGLRRLRRIAGHLGLPAVVRIITDITICLERDDPAALAATRARLARVINHLHHDRRTSN